MEKQVRIPEFKTLEEMAEFWDNHDLTDFENEMEEVIRDIHYDNSDYSCEEIRKGEGGFFDPSKYDLVQMGKDFIAEQKDFPIRICEYEQQEDALADLVESTNPGRQYDRFSCEHPRLQQQNTGHHSDAGYG